MLSKQAAKSLVEWEPISEQIIMGRFDSKCQNTTIIQTYIYAPMHKGEEDTKEEFYDKQQATFNKTRGGDLTLVTGN